MLLLPTVHEGDPSNTGGGCLNCGATMVSAGRFMDQESLGAPRSLDSEILIVMLRSKLRMNRALNKRCQMKNSMT